jgi:predicted anti-sigma-YlaC factor YlaD
MNHQLFEEWLLDDDPSTPVDALKLEKHLQECEQCRALADGWHAAQQALDTAPQTKPSPGFATRFAAQLAEKRAHRQRRAQIGWIVGALSPGALATTLLAYPTLSQFTFAEIIISLVRGLGLVFTRIFELGGLARALFQSTSPLVPLALWIGLALNLTILSLLWVFAMWKIVVPKGVKA